MVTFPCLILASSIVPSCSTFFVLYLFLFIVAASQTTLTLVSPLSMTSSSFHLPPSKELNFSTQAVDEDTHHDVPTGQDWKFWCIILSLTLSVFLTAIEFVSRLFYPQRRGDVFLRKTYRRPQLGQPCQQLFVNWRESNLCGLVPHMHWALQPWSPFMAV
jgi:hypothetical protein